MKRKGAMKKVMDKRISIFVHILSPTIAVMLFQVVLISLVLFLSGTIGSLERSARESLYRHAENRSITLENMMVRTWSNLDKLEGDIPVIIDQYLADNRLSPRAVFGVPAREKELLSHISDELLQTMRMTLTTGSFLFFLDDTAASADSVTLNGLYYRDFNPSMTSSDFSDVLLEKGPAGIAQQNGIPLSSLWSETYRLKPEHTQSWEAIFAPYQAARAYPHLATKDLSLWSNAHYLDPGSNLDTNSCITYTRPLFYNGALIGVIGVEVQIEHLKTFFPSGDIGDMGGYMLLHYRTDDMPQDASALSCTVGAVAGSYIKRLADFGSTLTLSKGQDEHIYRTQSENFPATSVAVRSLKLYNSNAPFSDSQWSLAAFAPDNILFADSNRIKNGILTSSLVSLVLGSVLMIICIRLVTRPLMSIVSQIQTGNDDLVIVSDSNAYEVRLLCDTINEMKRKRQAIEVALREEGERYMLALESAIDAFIEYDIVKDYFKIYFFTDESSSRALTSVVIENFCRDATYDRVCHPADARDFVAVLCGQRSEPCEMRLRTDLFPDTGGALSDGDYFWFSFSAVLIRAEDNTLEKTIGSATQITAEKLAEFARREAARRDVTTGVYNREYGTLLLQRYADRAQEKIYNDSLVALVLDNFEQLEAYYGRIFGAAILQEISNTFFVENPAIRHVVRWGNAAFLFFCPEREVPFVVAHLRTLFARVYSGENEDLKLGIHLGVVPWERGWAPEEGVARAFAAAYACEGSGVEVMSYDPQTMSIRTEEALLGDARTDTPYDAIDISRATIVGVTFSLFEHTNDVGSVINMLLRILGRLFALDCVIICEYDEDFGSNRVVQQWATDDSLTYHSDLERINHADFLALTNLLGERGFSLYDSESVRDYSPGTRQLLCVRTDTAFSAICCAMFEDGAHTGRLLFSTTDKNRIFSVAEISALYEVSKIISTRFNLERSHSASRAKSEFLSKMSHEIRTPMNAIIGLTRMAKETGYRAGQIEDFMEKIDMSAKHLLTLINDILDMSRIESGKLNIENHPFSLVQLIASIDALMRPQFEEKTIAFHIDHALTHAAVLGDEQKLRQIFLNLLGNACKFTPENGSVTFSVSQEVAPDGSSCRCRFSVRDTGVGIAREDQISVFSAFEQSASSNQAAGNPQGTGLGLAISNNFVSAMGGRIELVSEPGVGSEFFFTLSFPFDGDSSAANPADASADEVFSHFFRDKRALIVDDNEINLEIATFIVENIGFVSEVAHDGQEALEKFLTAEPGYYDVILMDINMPVMDGFAATREIRKRVERPDARSIPIIAMTANAFSEDTKKSMEAGMNAHVAKPIDVDFLYNTLKSLFPA